MIRFKVSQNEGNGAKSGLSGAGTIEVCSLRPNDSGAIAAQSVATSENPTQRMTP